jgi:hypothetical protein
MHKLADEDEMDNDLKEAIKWIIFPVIGIPILVLLFICGRIEP